MRRISILLMVAVLLGCETAPPTDPGPEAELRQELAGLVPGEPADCLPFNRSGGMESFGGNAILFRDGRRLWLSRAEGGACELLDSPGYTLLTRTTGSRLCSGDIGRVVDLTAGITAGSCVLGPFVPYTRP